MRSLVAVLFVLALAIPSAADAAGLRSRKVKVNKVKKTDTGAVAKRPGTSRGLTGIFKRRQPGSKGAVRRTLGRAVTKVRQEATFERVAIRAPIAAMKFGSTVTFGAALTTGRPSVIVMAGVMTAAAYALGPAMKLAERIGERIGERILARADQRGG